MSRQSDLAELAGNNFNGDAILVDAAGHVTKPLQPSFSCIPASTQSNISLNADVTIVWGTEITDIGGNFASNVFTAPVTGKYQFSFCVSLRAIDSAANYYEAKLLSSNRSYRIIFDPDFGQDSGFWSLQMSVLADMDTGDTASVALAQVAGTAQTDISVESWFTGTLIS